MMNKLIENIENEVIDLKKSINRWSDQSDLGALQVAKQNLAHAYDWMLLLNKTIDEVYCSTKDVSPIVTVANETIVSSSQKESEQSKAKEIEVMTSEETSQIEMKEEARENKDKELIPSMMVVEPYSLSKDRNEIIEENSEYMDSLLGQSYEKKAIDVTSKRSSIIEKVILGEHLLKMNEGVYASLSLNDIFRFSREWFDGNSKELEQFLHQIEKEETKVKAFALIHKRLSVDKDSQDWLDFFEVIEKYFETKVI